MPHFVAKKRCFYEGQMYPKGTVVEFFQPVSAQSWEAMDEEGKELLFNPEDVNEQAEFINDSENEFTKLKVTHELLLNELEDWKQRVSSTEQERDTARQSVTALQKENETLARSAEASTAMQGKVAALKQMVADNENKSVLEKAIIEL